MFKKTSIIVILILILFFGIGNVILKQKKESTPQSITSLFYECYLESNLEDCSQFLESNFLEELQSSESMVYDPILLAQDMPEKRYLRVDNISVENDQASMRVSFPDLWPGHEIIVSLVLKDNWKIYKIEKSNFGWKVKESNIFHYSFSYPDGWFLNENAECNYEDCLEGIYVEKEESIFHLLIFQAKGVYSIDQWILQSEISSLEVQRRFSLIEAVQFGGEEILAWRDKTNSSESIEFIRDEKFYRIDYMSTEEQFQKDLATLQRIFSSFRFTKSVCNEEWGPLVEGVSSWKSAVTRTASAKMIESESGYKVTVPLFSETTIKDKNGDIVSSLKIGDYISIDGLYRMRGKFSDYCDWEVRFEKVSEINVIGKCTTEGKENIPGTICCPWLVSVGEERYCTRCGDGICKTPENKENCPLDCAQIGDEILITIKQLQKDDFVLEDDFIRAKENPTNLSVMVLVEDETKFYSRSGTKVLNEYSFLEFYDLMKKWSAPSWFFKVKGILKGENKIKAEEVYYYVQ